IDQAIEARVNLDTSGVLVGQASRLSPSKANQTNMESGKMPDLRLTVPANGESRADWVIKITEPGEVKFKVTARGGKYADAMEKTYTAYEHGIEKFIAKSGKARGDDITVKLDLPHE